MAELVATKGVNWLVRKQHSVRRFTINEGNAGAALTAHQARNGCYMSSMAAENDSKWAEKRKFFCPSVRVG